MIVFDLRCGAHGHPFEAWFGSSADYDDQQARGLIACPLCGDTDVRKAPMAPAVPAKGNRQAGGARPVAMVPDGQAVAAPDMAKMKAVMERLAAAQRDALKDSQWVGRDFADTARAIHYGEQDAARIHGEVAPDEARALIEEGVPVAPLPFPVVPPEAQN
ncbi:DUF1178 family protein [Sphingobium algorifonticola]|uniref:DUF1178 family protein n=1 Tax=Sphingobium algorifonticola TaxID=2008318 RepID=A0A437J5F1_9SPHN|nr:DUF1178 family protein [Sphingobium algorifonticola]RVT40170.1 DUF1178 family protein [Sphingobium algorifonticola]